MTISPLAHFYITQDGRILLWTRNPTPTNANAHRFGYEYDDGVPIHQVIDEDGEVVGFWRDDDPPPHDATPTTRELT